MLLNEDIPVQHQGTSTARNIGTIICRLSTFNCHRPVYVCCSFPKTQTAFCSKQPTVYYKTIRGCCWWQWQCSLCNNSLLHPRCCRSSPIHYFGRRACHPKRGHKGGCKQHYSCWQWNCWNRWGGVLSAPGLGERIHWHHLSQWSWWRTFCRERWWTRWRGFDHHGRWPTAKEAEENSEPGVSLLLRSNFFIFRYLVFCFKIILGS